MLIRQQNNQLSYTNLNQKQQIKSNLKSNVTVLNDCCNFSFTGRNKTHKILTFLKKILPEKQDKFTQKIIDNINEDRMKILEMLKDNKDASVYIEKLYDLWKSQMPLNSNKPEDTLNLVKYKTASKGILGLSSQENGTEVLINILKKLEEQNSLPDPIRLESELYWNILFKSQPMPEDYPISKTHLKAGKKAKNL